MKRQHGARRRPLDWATLLVLVLAGIMTALAAGAARSVRDENERRLLAERADGIGQIMEGLGGSFEADLLAAAAYASQGTDATGAFAAYVASSRDENTATGTWALVDRTPDGYRVAFVDPSGSATYFDGRRVPEFERQLAKAFDGDFAVAGVFGEGVARRLGIAAGVPGAGNGRIVYLEFPLLAVAASAPTATEGASLFENIDMGLYVGDTPSTQGLVFGTFDGLPPAGAMRASFDVGGQTILVVVDETAPLSGRLAHELPLIILGFGLAVTGLAALVVEVARRKQRAAVEVATEIKAQHAALDRAVADRAKAEAGMLEAQKREALGLLAGGIAHDFNNLLAVITGYCELLLAQVRGEQIEADIAEVMKAAERGASLTRQLLLFARDEKDERASAEANVVMGDMSRLLDRTVGEEITLIADLDASPSDVPMSASELEQIVVNLVVNARHAILGDGCIAVRTRSADEGRHVIIEVADDGEGMSPQVAARAFEPLFTTRARGEGTGLGLATVASIVKRVGGVATIDSAVGKGTTVRIVLPLAEHVTAVHADQPATEPAATEDRRGTVLLVEDEPSVRKAMARMLSKRGFRVHEATSGVDAVDRFLDTCVPDLVVTDVIMPGGLNGKDVVDRFRTRHPDLPVVFVSGYAPELLAQQGVADGPVRLLAKPFTERELHDAAMGALGERPNVDSW